MGRLDFRPSVGGLALFGALAAGTGAMGGPTAPPVKPYPGCAEPPQSFHRAVHVVPGPPPTSPNARGALGLAAALRQARPGDVLYLASGNYGDVALAGENAGFITLTAEPGQKPVLRRLTFGGPRPARRWRVSGLTIEGFAKSALDANGWQQHPFLVQDDGGSDLIVDNNEIMSTPYAYRWRSETKGQGDDQALSGGITIKNASCVAVIDNRISNIWDGISVGGDQHDGRGQDILISNNHISDFAGDGVDHFASHIIIVGNDIENGHDVCDDVCIHNDGIQGWNYNSRADLINFDVHIIGNTIIDRSRPSLEFSDDDLHGITIFDGNWKDVIIANNVVVSSTWNGIALYGVQNASIVNNTVLSPSASRSAWIAIKQKKGGSSGTKYSTLIRNNITSMIVIGQRGQPVDGVTLDHNMMTGTAIDLFTKNPRNLFVAFDPKAGRYDLHLSATSAARRAGADSGAPQDDLEGHRRIAPADDGALARTAPST